MKKVISMAIVALVTMVGSMAAVAEPLDLIIPPFEETAFVEVASEPAPAFSDYDLLAEVVVMTADDALCPSATTQVAFAQDTPRIFIESDITVAGSETAAAVLVVPIPSG